jgi:cellulose synthase/poly-beta-1,6-N-acetylglucosamine synthase-like glycosyltransferase
MTPLSSISSALFILSVSGVMLVFVVNPLILWILYALRREKALPGKAKGVKHSVSVIVVVHNGEKIIADKIENALSLKYPSDQWEVIVFSDGSTDSTVEKVKSYAGRNKRVKLLTSARNEGKHAGLNAGAAAAKGDVLVFTDADAILDKESVVKLLSRLSDEKVGGVCGQRVIDKGEARGGLKDAQKGYIRFDSAIKKWESGLGSLTSNDGKIYAVRRPLFKGVPPAVTDDLYVCLSTLSAGYGFVFEPEARASVRVPSLSPAHELQRRRRIVARSLRGIFMNAGLLNPFSHGLLSFRLFVNKVLRRFLPLMLIALFFSSALLSPGCKGVFYLFLLQAVFYLLALSHVFLAGKKRSLALKPGALAYYFCLGNYGNLLALYDLAVGKKFVTWTPASPGAPGKAN